MDVAMFVFVAEQLIEHKGAVLDLFLLLLEAGPSRGGGRAARSRCLGLLHNIQLLIRCSRSSALLARASGKLVILLPSMNHLLGAIRICIEGRLIHVAAPATPSGTVVAGSTTLADGLGQEAEAAFWKALRSDAGCSGKTFPLMFMNHPLSEIRICVENLLVDVASFPVEFVAITAGPTTVTVAPVLETDIASWKPLLSDGYGEWSGKKCQVVNQNLCIMFHVLAVLMSDDDDAWERARDRRQVLRHGYVRGFDPAVGRVTLGPFFLTGAYWAVFPNWL